MTEKVDLEVLLRRTEDGQTASYSYDVEPQYLGGQVFWWSEGNAACDCNRDHFFRQALGLEPDDDVACSDGRFVVDWIKRAGSDDIIYSEA